MAIVNVTAGFLAVAVLGILLGVIQIILFYVDAWTDISVWIVSLLEIFFFVILIFSTCVCA